LCYSQDWFSGGLIIAGVCAPIGTAARASSGPDMFLQDHEIVTLYTNPTREHVIIFYAVLLKPQQELEPHKFLIPFSAPTASMTEASGKKVEVK